MKLKLLITILLLAGIAFAQTTEKESPKKAVNKDSTELVQLEKQLNDLNMNIVNSKASLHDRKKQIEADEKSVDLMEINLQMVQYAIAKQRELIEAKKPKDSTDSTVKK